MRKIKSEESKLNCVNLQNGLMLKGSYAYSHSGLQVTLYLVNSVGRVLAYRSYGFAKNAGEAQEKMCALLSGLSQLCAALKVDRISQPRIQEAAAKTVMLALTKEAVFKNAA